MRSMILPGTAGTSGDPALLFGRYLRRIIIVLISASFIPAMAGSLLAMPGEEEISDKEIVKAIESDLLISRTVSAHLIDVDCKDGIVTLRGSADNLLARDQAVRIANTFKGVKSVVNLIEISPVLMPDEEILANVRSAIASDPATELYEVNAEVRNGVVVLTGTVDSMAEKRLTGLVASSVRGVRDVENNINIYFATSRPDGEIEQEIEKCLQYNPYIYSGLIDVQVEDGQVRLSGTVGSSADKTRAYSDAWVSGVRMVDVTDLKVKWWLTDRLKRGREAVETSDEAVEEAIGLAFVNDPRVLSFEIDVEVDEGVVTLRGTVDNLKAKRAAQSDAENTVGVSWVDNYIKVRPRLVPDDSELKRSVENALLLDPVLGQRDFTILARNGKVYLYGYVDSFYEKFHASDVVSRVWGVVEIQNNVAIHYPGIYVTDDRIEREIRKKLMWSFVIDAGDIDVTVEEGVATLNGEVSDWREYKAIIRQGL